MNKNKEIVLKLLASFFGHLSTIVLNLVFPLIVTRIYGDVILGTYTYNLSIIKISRCLATLGLATGLLYYIPRTGKKYILSSFITVLFSSTFIVSIGIVLTQSPTLKKTMPLLILYSIEVMFYSLYRVNQQIKEYFLINICLHNGVKIAVAFILAVVIEPSMNMLIIASYVGGTVAVFMYWWTQRQMFEGFCFQKEVLKYSLPLTIGTIMQFIMSQMDKIMIGNMIDKTAVAIYSVSTGFALFPSLFLASLNTIFPPMISKLYHAGDYRRLREIYSISVKFLLITSTSTVLLVVLLSGHLLGMYGEIYLQGRWVLIMTCFGQMVNAGVGSVWYMVSMSGNSMKNLQGKGIAMAVNLTLNFILIPIYGINGAAFATMCSVTVNNLIGFWFARRILKGPTSNTITVH